jgi:L-ribulose-5-phosphate 3-epimerase UlaE
MIQFGTGKVDFATFFKKLKSLGFSGPVMVEGTEVAPTLEQTIANARANREYLERIFGRFRVVRYEDTDGIADFGMDQMRLVRLCAQKP